MADQENEENPEADKASWTIKSVPVATRKLAVACASRAGVTMAEWLDRAVRNQANLEAGERVLPPAPRPAAGLPAVVSGPAVLVDLGGLADLMHAAHEVAEAAGVPMPKVTACARLGHGAAPGRTWFASDAPKANRAPKRANHRRRGDRFARKRAKANRAAKRANRLVAAEAAPRRS